MIYVTNLDDWTNRSPVAYEDIEAVPERFRHKCYLLDAASNSDYTTIPHLGTRAVSNGRKFYYLCASFKYVNLATTKGRGADRYRVSLSNENTNG